MLTAVRVWIWNGFHLNFAEQVDHNHRNGRRFFRWKRKRKVWFTEFKSSHLKSMKLSLLENLILNVWHFCVSVWSIMLTLSDVLILQTGGDAGDGAPWWWQTQLQFRLGGPHSSPQPAGLVNLLRHPDTAPARPTGRENIPISSLYAVQARRGLQDIFDLFMFSSAWDEKNDKNFMEMNWRSFVPQSARKCILSTFFSSE